MNRPIALLWLFFTLAPFAYFIFFISYMTGMDHASHAVVEAQFNFMFRLHIAAMLGIWVLIAAYIVYLFKTDHVPVEKRALWAVVLFLGNMVAMPFFWYFYVWRPLNKTAPVGT